MACRGWLAATKHLPPGKTNVWAEAGTAAHEVLELALTFDLDPLEVCKDEDVARAVGHAVDWVKSYRSATPDTTYQSEMWLPFGEALGYPALSGTADLVMENDVELVIGDYKHGAGYVVEPDSPQLMCYMIGLRHIVGQRSQYRQVIFQPRARHVDGPVREYTYTDTDLDHFAEKVRHAVKENLRGTAPRTPGDHCRWCTAAPTCRALAEKALRVAATEFAAADFARLVDG